MTQTDITQWGVPILLPDEHRIFPATEHWLRHSFPRGYRPNEEHGEWAIADNSGSTPETTDDGVLWIDFSKPIMIGKGNDSPCIPVMEPDGTTHIVITNVVSLFILMGKFNMTANVDGEIFRAVRW